MTIDTTGFKVTKLPPAITEGGDYIDLTKWAGTHSQQHRNKKQFELYQQYQAAYERGFGVGSNKHVELLDAGGTLAADDLGLPDAPFLTEPLKVLRADDPHPRRGGSKFGGASTGGFHQRNHGIQGEVNNV